MDVQMEALKCSLWEQAPRPPQDKPWSIFLELTTTEIILLDLWMPLPSSSWMFHHPFQELTPSMLPIKLFRPRRVEGC